MASDSGWYQGSITNHLDNLLGRKIGENYHQVGVGIVVEIQMRMFLEKEPNISGRQRKRQDRPVDDVFVKRNDVVHPFYFVDKAAGRHHQKTSFFFVDDGDEPAEVFFFDIAGSDL